MWREREGEGDIVYVFNGLLCVQRIACPLFFLLFIFFLPSSFFLIRGGTRTANTAALCSEMGRAGRPPRYACLYH